MAYEAAPICRQSKKFFLKFIYSEKAKKFWKIFPSLLSAVHTVKSKGKILKNFVAFSEYMNFTCSHISVETKMYKYYMYYFQ